MFTDLEEDVSPCSRRAGSTLKSFFLSKLDQQLIVSKMFMTVQQSKTTGGEKTNFSKNKDIYSLLWM